MASVKQAWIKKYGEEEGLRRFEEQKKKYNSNGVPPKGKNMKSYWMDLGYSEEDAKIQVSLEQRKRNPFCDEYYVHRGITDLEEIRQRKEIVRCNAKRGSKRSVEYYIIKGFTKEDAIQEQYKYQSSASSKSSKFKGHQHSKESKERIGLKTKTNKLEEIKRLGKDVWLDRNFGDQHNNTGCISKLERLIQESIKQSCSNLVFKFNKKIPNTSYIVDIQVNNKIIEINGDYWHCNPEIYKSGDYIKKPGGDFLVDDQWNKDAIRYKDLKKLGYSIFIIWERDWKYKKDIILDQVIKFIYETN